MILFYCAIGFAIVFFIWDFKDFGSFLDSFLFGALGALVGTLVGLIFLLIGNASIATMPVDKLEIEYSDPIELVSLKDSFGLEDGRYLFGGYFDEELKYIYVYDDPVNGMKIEKIKANSSYIKYLEDDTNPYIQPWRYHHKNKIIDHLFGGTFIKYTIYLPAGSVIEDTYQIDLE